MLLRVTLFSLFFFGVLLLDGQDSTKGEYKVYYYEGGGKSSEGYLVDGKPDGYWKSYYINGNLKTEGNRKGFLLDGVWKFYDEEGVQTFTISYGDGVKNGSKIAFKDGLKYKSEPFVNDTLQGWKTIFYEDGKVHKQFLYAKGELLDNGFEFANDDGRVITIYVHKGGELQRRQSINRFDGQSQKQGLWVEFYKGYVKKVEGTYQNNLKHGYWKYYDKKGNLLKIEKWINGELVEGASETAKIKIERKLNPQTGKLAFKGAYKNGKANGVHRYYNKEGKVDSSVVYEEGIILFVGRLDDEGRKQGLWKEFYRDGTLKAIGRYKNDKKIGEWKYFFATGKLEQKGSYLSGQAEGRWEWYYETGELRLQEEYAMGLADGASIEYSDTASVIARGEYISGLKEGKWEYWLNDHKVEGNYFEGAKNGSWREYYADNGKLRFEGKYENNQENGLHAYYFANGTVKRRGAYKFGVKDGVWEYFSETGAKIINIEYEEGKEVKYNGKKVSYGKRIDRELED